MLCSSCDSERHRMFLESRKQKKDDADCTESASVSAQSAEVTQPQPPERRAPIKPQAKQKEVTIFNELLMYVTCQRDKSNTASLRSVISSFYSSSEISHAKKQIVTYFGPHLSSCEFVIERRNSVQRSATDAETEDITEMLNILDNTGVLRNVRFAALQYSRLPKYDPEELNICAVVDRQVATDNTISSLNAKVEALAGGCDLTTQTANTSKIVQTVESMCTSIQSLKDQLNELAGKCDQLASSSGEPVTKTAEQDRSCNVVLSGIPECRDINIWRSQVVEALSVTAGRELTLADAFRLGRYNADRSRPILVKLMTVWDKRLVLSGARKLRDVPEFRRVFVNADEPLDVRRRNILNRLKSQAIAARKDVSVTDGVLFVDGAPKFSLVNGFIRDDTSRMSGLSLRNDA